MDKWEGKIAVVTGASEGMGKHLIKKLVKHGMIVFGLARNVEKVEKLSKELKNEKGKLIPQKCNLINLVRINEIFKYIDENFGGVAIAVNMAATATGNDLLEDKIEIMQYALLLNVLAPTLICKLAVQSMRKHNIDGHIINVGGTAGYFTSVMDDCHFYSVSKFILRALGDGLRMEFRSNNINIRISNIGPGHVKAGGQDRGNAKGSDLLEGLKLAATEMYNMNDKKLPKKMPFSCDGEDIYHKNILPALEMDDVIDCIIQIISSPQGCEVMDMIVKPTDRNHSIFESDFYWRP